MDEAIAAWSWEQPSMWMVPLATSVTDVDGVAPWMDGYPGGIPDLTGAIALTATSERTWVMPRQSRRWRPPVAPDRHWRMA